MNCDFSEFENTLNNMENALKNLNGDIPFDILFNTNFMTKYTNYSSCSEFLDRIFR